ncbi:MAG: EAL domain-containing protein [Cyanobacteria bacterium P01_E01_bin.6]
MLSDYLQILLFEDDQEDAELLQEYLEIGNSVHYVVVHVKTLSDGLIYLNDKNIKQCFDLILLDLSLPDKHGLDTVCMVHEAACDIPIVVLTGLDDEAISLEALRQGAQDYLIKHTVNERLLCRTIQYAIERGRLLNRLSISEARYAIAVQGSNDGLWDWDLTTDEIYFSPRWKKMLGYDDHEIRNQPNDWFSRVHEDNFQEMMLSIEHHLLGHHPHWQNEHKIQRKDGSFSWVLCRGTAAWNEDGQPYRFAGSLTDITERKQLEKKLFEEKELALVTLNSIGDAVITTDVLGHIESLNPAAEKLTGWQLDEVKGKPVSYVFELVNGDTLEPISNPVQTVLNEDRTVRLSNHPMLITRDRQPIAIDDSVAPIHSSDGHVIGSVIIFHDVSEERGRAKQLAWRANHDALTGLLNRCAFQSHLEQAIATGKKHQHVHTLCYIDLDHFKIVNDTCGHAAGDELLRQVSMLLQRRIRKTDIVARLGGDEFGILLQNCPLTRAVGLSNTICEELNQFRFVWQDQVFRIGGSIGIAMMDGQTQSVEHVIKAADSACYGAKRRGRGRTHIYQDTDASLSQHSQEIQWFNRLTQALESEQFELFYQLIRPSQTLASDKHHYEVLLRLRDDQNNVITPGAFLSAAERYNLMPSIDRWVIRTFFNYLAETLSHRNSALDSEPLVPIAHVYAINLSGASVNDETFIDFIREQFSIHQIPARKICFEITETVAVANLTKAADLMTELRELGCQFALDDFGTGMSSLAYLKALPVDYLKIDGNFIRGIAHDPISCAMVEAINNIGHLIGVQTVAEFVSSPAILEAVKRLGIDYVQGYGIAMPSPLTGKISCPQMC